MSPEGKGVGRNKNRGEVPAEAKESFGNLNEGFFLVP